MKSPQQLGRWPWVFLALAFGALAFVTLDRSLSNATTRSSCRMTAVALRYEIVADPVVLREHRITFRELVDSLRTAIGEPSEGWGSPTIPVVVVQRPGAERSYELRVPHWVAYHLDLHAVVVRWRSAEPPMRLAELAQIRLVELSTSSCRDDAPATAVLGVGL